MIRLVPLSDAGWLMDDITLVRSALPGRWVNLFLNEDGGMRLGGHPRRMSHQAACEQASIDARAGFKAIDTLCQLVRQEWSQHRTYRISVTSLARAERTSASPKSCRLSTATSLRHGELGTSPSTPRCKPSWLTLEGITGCRYLSALSRGARGRCRGHMPPTQCAGPLQRHLPVINNPQPLAAE